MARQIVPHDLAAEQSVIGACILNEQACAAALAMLQPEDFFSILHQHLFEGIRKLYVAGEVVDSVSLGALTEQFDPSVRTLLNEMGNLLPSVTSMSYANTVLAHAKSRALIALSADIARAGYDGIPASEAAAHFATILSDSELLRRHESVVLRGYYDDIGTADDGLSRDDTQPWIARGVLRRGQRMMVVARAGIGKSFLLRQMAFAVENGLHCWTGQRTERPRRALIVELEAGMRDILDSQRSLLVAMQRRLSAPSMAGLAKPALLHRPGGLDLREPEGVAALEGAIQKAQPELVVMGPLKYMSIAKPGENYEIAALRLMGVLNELLAKYDFALVLEAHFSRGDHGAPGGSERWVDWPDTGFGIHPPDDDITRRLVVGGDGVEMGVTQFRIPRDSQVWVPTGLVRGADHRLPWSVSDVNDPYRMGTIYSTRYGGTAAALWTPTVQEPF